MPTPLRAIRVSDEIWEAAQEQATRRGESVTEAIRRFLTEYAEANES